MLLLYPELENILADNAKSGNAHSTGRACFQRHRAKNTGHDDQRHNASHVIDSTGKYTIKLAHLGGYMGNKNKYTPGNIVIWRGLRRLNEIQTGWEVATGRCG